MLLLLLVPIAGCGCGCGVGCGGAGAGASAGASAGAEGGGGSGGGLGRNKRPHPQTQKNTIPSSHQDTGIENGPQCNGDNATHVKSQVEALCPKASAHLPRKLSKMTFNHSEKYLYWSVLEISFVARLRVKWATDQAVPPALSFNACLPRNSS